MPGKRLLPRKERKGFPAKETPRGCPHARCRLSQAHPCSSLQSVLHLTSYPPKLVLAPFPRRPKRPTLALGSPQLAQQAELELQRRRAPAPGLEDEEEGRHPAGCKVPKQHLLPRPESRWGTGRSKSGRRYNKVEGSHGEVSRARGEVGTRSGTCRSRESWRVWLAGFCDAACPCCRDPVSPRSPAPAAAAAGERASPHARVAESADPARQELGASGGGRDRAGPVSQSTPCCPLLLPPPGVQLSARASPRPRARRSRADRRKLRGSHGEPHARMVRPRHSGAGLASRPRPKCKVTSSGVSRPTPEGYQGQVPRLPPCTLPGENRNSEEK